MSDFRLTEDETRAKVRELIDRKSQIRLDVWLYSGIMTGVLDGEMVERLLYEEMADSPPDIQAWWDEACELCGPMEECTHD